MPTPLLDVLAQEYGATGAHLTSILEEPGRAVYRVDRTNGAAWVLRQFSPRRTYEQVAGDAQVLDYVQHLVVEQLVETRDGRGGIEVDGRGVIVTEFEEGPLARPSPTVLQAVGATLGALHQLEPSTAPGTTRRAGSLPAEDLALARWYLADIADDVPGDRRGSYERLAQDVASTSDCEDLPTSLVHSDCHLANVVDADRGAVLFDWEGAGQGPAVASLGWLLYSATVQSPNGPAQPFNPQLVDAVLDGYGQHRALSQRELGRLPDAVRFRPLVIAVREFRESIITKTPASAVGWWSRYPEAETVAQHAALLMAR